MPTFKCICFEDEWWGVLSPAYNVQVWDLKNPMPTYYVLLEKTDKREKEKKVNAMQHKPTGKSASDNVAYKTVVYAKQVFHC